jgi:ElaB/YqjD/DUF883 family membrane-anchored ribosome-binding protein
MQTNKGRQMRRDKWQSWYDSLSPQTKEYLKSQPLWHDIDLAKAVAVGLAIGFLIGLCVR